MTFHGKTFTDLLKGLKRSLTTQKALKRLRKALEALEIPFGFFLCRSGKRKYKRQDFSPGQQQDSSFVI